MNSPESTANKPHDRIAAAKLDAVPYSPSIALALERIGWSTAESMDAPLGQL